MSAAPNAAAAQRQAVQQALLAARGLALAVPQSGGRGSDGGLRQRRHGNSQEFQEYRDYRQGDDLRHLDWGVYGRSDQLVVRRFHHEVSPHLDLLLDGSQSMLGEQGLKGWATASLGAFFARCADHGGFHQRAWRVGERLEPLTASSKQKASLEDPSLKDSAPWESLTFGDARSPSMALMGRRHPWKARGVRLLISDLMWPEAPRRLLRGVRSGAVAAAVIQVLEQDEVHPKARGFVRLEDAESGQHMDLLLDAASVAGYEDALERQRRSWLTACQGHGVLWLRLVAEDVLDAWRRAAAGQPAPILHLFQTLLQGRLLQAAPGR